MTKVLTCTCEHKFQDKTRGNKRRVHNEMAAKKGTETQWRCTVCATVRTA